jgi:predicted 2-oxoglutarate/Fe(II)-dependent dioxygenase YbiX
VPELLEVADFLAGDALDRIRSEMRAAAGAAATVTGAAPEATTTAARRSTRLDVADDARAEVVGLLEGLLPRLADHFGRALDAVEEPQFLHYGPGDYFVAHQDGNTPLLHDDTRFRKVSAVVFVSDPGDYEGGAFVLDPFGARRELRPAPGTFVAFPSETTHEVEPATAGERLTIAAWFRGPEG